MKNQKGAKPTAVQATRRDMRKDARINIAVEEGLPHQSLIASVLHKYVSGRALSGKKAG